jgi:hypothetical protein
VFQWIWTTTFDGLIRQARKPKHTTPLKEAGLDTTMRVEGLRSMSRVNAVAYWTFLTFRGREPSQIEVDRCVQTSHGPQRGGTTALDLGGDSSQKPRHGCVGKTSLLSLLFAGVRTNKRDFLGQRAEEKVRRISDYVGPNDHGVVVCEWELDAAQGLFDDSPQRYLSGVFYRRKPSCLANYGPTLLRTRRAGIRRSAVASACCCMHSRS